MSYLTRLSPKQSAWWVATLLAVVAIVGVGWALEPKAEDMTLTSFSTDGSIRQIAPKLGTTGFAMAKELDLPRDVDKDQPLGELGVDQEQLDDVTTHLLSHRGRRLKYFVFAALVLFGLVFLTRLGRPDGSPNSERKTWYPRTPYLAALVVALAVCGFALGKSPNPMEGAVKIFKAAVGLQPSVSVVVLAFLFFVGLAIVGNKLVCGWACPIGAVQELIYSLPVLKRLKRRKVPFFLSNSIRGGLFLLMLLLLFAVVGGKKGFVIYHFVNPFNLFGLHFETLSILITVVVVLGLAVATYRPFCQFVCPFGFVSWLAERVSLFRVRVDRARCNQCGACSRACPTGAAAHKVDGKLFAADCYSCARCLNVCPEEAIAYRCVVGKTPASPSEPTAESANSS